MTNPYQTPNATESPRGDTFGNLNGGFVWASLPAGSIACGLWMLWVLFLAYHPRASASDSLGVFLLGVSIGLFAGKITRGPIVKKTLAVLACSGVPIIVIVGLSRFRQLRTASLLEIATDLSIAWLLFLAVGVVVAKICHLVSFLWHRFKTNWDKAAECSTSGPRFYAVAIVAQRLALAVFPLLLIRFLECGLITVRVYWFHDFLFVDPWLWFTAPLAIFLAYWAISPTRSDPSWFATVISLVLSVLIAAVLLLLALPFGMAAVEVLDEKSATEDRWLACNALLAFTWFYRSIVGDFAKKHVQGCEENQYGETVQHDALQ